MANISFDTEDRPIVLRLIRDMLNDLLGDNTTVTGDTVTVTYDPSATNTGPVPDNFKNTVVVDGDSATSKDQKGVEFNADFCSKSEKPFYDKGTRQGQWKKRRGVEETEYDKWYAGELSKQSPVSTDEREGVNTAAAFTQETPAAPEPTGPTINTFGDLMGWVADKQNAGLLDYEADLMNGYDQAARSLGIQKIEIQELFEDTDDSRRKVRAVYDALSQKAGA